MIHKDFKAKNARETGGIVPDIVVDFDPAKARAATFYTTNLIYSPSKKTVKPEKENAEDPVLERAIEILKARDVLGNLNASTKKDK